MKKTTVHGLVALGLLMLALVSRVFAPGDFWTNDEAKHWSLRAEAFLDALQAGDYAGTNLTGHPGVTTMWLGATGVLLYESLVEQGRVAPVEPALAAVEQDNYGAAAAIYSAAPADFALYRNLLRLPVALVTALWVPLIYLLLLRLFDGHVAALAALLLATDPFLVAHGRLLHLDALLTTFMSLALLAALAAFHMKGDTSESKATMHWPLLFASAVAGGLAFLTKSPSVLLLPMVGLIALAGVRPWSWQRLRLALTACLVWGITAACVCVVLWPALWVAPLDTIMRVVNEVINNGGAAHGWGTFFLGQAVDDAGVLFYPVALLLRLTPWATLGIVAAALVRPRRSSNGDEPDRQAWLEVTPLALLLVFALLFLLVMSIPPKKFDRYILPIFPVLNIVAAVGWIRASRLVFNQIQLRRRHVALLYGFVASVLTLNLAWYHPYELAYYNPLVGGGGTAVRTVYVGWGEGLEEAGAYIKAQPDGCDYPLASWYEETILPYVCAPVMSLPWAATPGSVNYVVLYVNQLQRNIYADVTAQVREQGALVHTVTIHGIDYAAVYQLPQPIQHPVNADFGDAVLSGYAIDDTALRTTGVLTLTTQWQARATLTEDYMLFIHVLDESGKRVSQIDVPPAGPDRPTSTWRHNHYYQWSHPVPLGSDLPAGSYWLAVGLYRPEDFTRLPVQGATQPGAPAYEADALLLAPVVIR